MKSKKLGEIFKVPAAKVDKASKPKKAADPKVKAVPKVEGRKALTAPFSGSKSRQRPAEQKPATGARDPITAGYRVLN